MTPPVASFDAWKRFTPNTLNPTLKKQRPLHPPITEKDIAEFKGDHPDILKEYIKSLEEHPNVKEQVDLTREALADFLARFFDNYTDESSCSESPWHRIDIGQLNSTLKNLHTKEAERYQKRLEQGNTSEVVPVAPPDILPQDLHTLKKHYPDLLKTSSKLLDQAFPETTFRRLYTEIDEINEALRRTFAKKINAQTQFIREVESGTFHEGSIQKYKDAGFSLEEQPTIALSEFSKLQDQHRLRTNNPSATLYLIEPLYKAIGFLNLPAIKLLEKHSPGIIQRAIKERAIKNSRDVELGTPLAALNNVQATRQTEMSTNQFKKLEPKFKEIGDYLTQQDILATNPSRYTEALLNAGVDNAPSVNAHVLRQSSALARVEMEKLKKQARREKTRQQRQKDSAIQSSREWAIGFLKPIIQKKAESRLKEKYPTPEALEEAKQKAQDKANVELEKLSTDLRLSPAEYMAQRCNKKAPWYDLPTSSKPVKSRPTAGRLKLREFIPRVIEDTADPQWEEVPVRKPETVKKAPKAPKNTQEYKKARHSTEQKTGPLQRRTQQHTTVFSQNAAERLPSKVIFTDPKNPWSDSARIADLKAAFNSKTKTPYRAVSKANPWKSRRKDFSHIPKGVFDSLPPTVQRLFRELTLECHATPFNLREFYTRPEIEPHVLQSLPQNVRDRIDYLVEKANKHRLLAEKKQKEIKILKRPENKRLIDTRLGLPQGAQRRSLEDVQKEIMKKIRESQRAMAISQAASPFAVGPTDRRWKKIRVSGNSSTVESKWKKLKVQRNTKHRVAQVDALQKHRTEMLQILRQQKAERKQEVNDQFFKQLLRKGPDTQFLRQLLTESKAKPRIGHNSTAEELSIPPAISTGSSSPQARQTPSRGSSRARSRTPAKTPDFSTGQKRKDYTDRLAALHPDNYQAFMSKAEDLIENNGFFYPTAYKTAYGNTRAALKYPQRRRTDVNPN